MANWTSLQNFGGPQLCNAPAGRCNMCVPNARRCADDGKMGVGRSRPDEAADACLALLEAARTANAACSACTLTADAGPNSAPNRGIVLLGSAGAPCAVRGGERVVIGWDCGEVLADATLIAAIAFGSEREQEQPAPPTPTAHNPSATRLP